MKKVGILIMAMLFLLSASVMVYAEDSETMPYDHIWHVEGDVDCNEEINDADVTLLRDILLGNSTPTKDRTANANGDTTCDINIADLVRLSTYVEDPTSVVLVPDYIKYE